MRCSGAVPHRQIASGRSIPVHAVDCARAGVARPNCDFAAPCGRAYRHAQTAIFPPTVAEPPIQLPEPLEEAALVQPVAVAVPVPWLMVPANLPPPERGPSWEPVHPAGPSRTVRPAKPLIAEIFDAAAEVTEKPSPVRAGIVPAAFGDSAALPESSPSSVSLGRTASGFGATGIVPAGLPPRSVAIHHPFDSVAVVTRTRAAPAVDARAEPTALEILSKPTPAYTDEARRLRIEGEVLLETWFGSAGQIRVLRVIRGLGHGLDQNAIAAAESIRFLPCQQWGKPVDTMAAVKITFRLAY